MIKLPEIKKKISGFLLSEEGQISKAALVGVGVALAGVGLQVAKAAHSSSSSLVYNKPEIRGTHTSSHSSGCTGQSCGSSQTCECETCETGCEVSCQEGCELYCQALYQGGCYTCQAGCLTCQGTCLTICEGCENCQTCQDTCQFYCEPFQQ